MPEEHIVSLTKQEWDLVGAALGKLPYELVAVLMEKIRLQLVKEKA